jgi:hypothetical protein
MPYPRLSVLFSSGNVVRLRAAQLGGENLSFSPLLIGERRATWNDLLVCSDGVVGSLFPVKAVTVATPTSTIGWPV